MLFAADYIRHDGGGPDFNKGILTAPSTNFFYAGPSLYQNINLTDVYFEPLVARQVLNARHWDVQTAKNDALMQVARNINRFEGRSRFSTWLHVVVANSARSTYRSLKRRSVEQAGEPGVRPQRPEQRRQFGQDLLRQVQHPPGVRLAG